MEAFRDSSSGELFIDDDVKAMLKQIESSVLGQVVPEQFPETEGAMVDFKSREYATEFAVTHSEIDNATDRFNYGVDFAAYLLKQWGIQKDVIIKVERKLEHNSEIIPITRIFAGKVMGVVIEQSLHNWDEYYHGEAKSVDSVAAFEPYFLISTRDEVLAMVPLGAINEIREIDTPIAKV
jgi:hypothetical protein